MAATVITPIPDKLGVGVDKWVVTFATSINGAAGGTANIEVLRASTITLQYISTNWNAKTLTFTCSNDDTNFVALTTPLSVGANGLFSVIARDIGYRYYQLALSGAPTAALTVTVIVNRLGR